MTEKPFLQEYTDQSFDDLIAMEDEYRIDSLVVAFDRAIQQKAERLGKESLTVEEQTVLAIEALEGGVNSGGFDSFFFNSTVEFAPIVVDSLNRIGCPKTAAIAQEAIDALEIAGEVSLDAIKAVMWGDDEDEEKEERRGERLGDCDEKFYEYAENIANCLFEFIKQNRDKVTLK